MKRFRGGLVFKADRLVFKAHRLVYHSTLGSYLRLIDFCITQL